MQSPTQATSSPELVQNQDPATEYYQIYIVVVRGTVQLELFTVEYPNVENLAF